MKCRSVLAPTAASSSVIDSAGLWLMPPLQRTKSMAMSAIDFSAMPSCPAPEGSRRTRTPSAATARSSWSMSHGAHFATPSSCSFSMRQPMRRCCAMASICAIAERTACSRSSSRGARTSMVKCTSPGITLMAPRLPDGYAVRIAGLEHCRFHRAGDGAAAQHGGAEAHAFFVAEAKHLDRKWQSLAPGRERGDALDRGDHAEHAVIAAGIAHGVEVRAEHQAGQAGEAAFIASDQIADRVEPGGEARLAHPAEHQVVGGAILRREIDACQAAGQLGMARERVAALQDASSGEHGSDSIFSP